MNEPITIPAVPAREHAVTRHCADGDPLAFMNLYRVYRRVLDEDESRALALVELEKANYATISELLGMSDGEVKMLLFRARQKLFLGMGRTLGELENASVA